MRGGRVFWQLVILATGGLVAVSQMLYFVAHGSKHYRLWWIGMQGYYTPAMPGSATKPRHFPRA